MLFYMDGIFFVSELEVRRIHDVFGQIFWINADTMLLEYLQDGVSVFRSGLAELAALEY